MDDNYISDVIDNIKQLTFEQYEVTAKVSRKNNGTLLDGICIHNRASNISPVIYINGYYENGMTPFETAVKVVERFEEIKEQELPVEVDEIIRFDKMKDRIMYRIINKEANAEFLKDVPWVEVADDLALVYYLDLDDGATVTIRNELMEIWDVSEEVLFDVAEINTPNKKPCEIRTLPEIILEMMEAEGELYEMKYDMGCEDMPDEAFKQMLLEEKNVLPMYVVRTGMSYGATVLMYDGAMNSIREQLGNDFFILPSSIHDLMIIPYDEEYDVAYLKSMVEAVNQEVLNPEEYLSDSVYFYDERGLSVVTDETIFQSARYEENVDYCEAR